MTEYVYRNADGMELRSDREMAAHVVTLFREGDQTIMDAFEEWVTANMHPWDALFADFNDMLEIWADMLRDLRPDLLERYTGYALYEVEYRRVNAPQEVDA